MVHEAGTELGPFVVDGVLGMGSMAYVYQVHRRGTDQAFALKILPLASADQRARMLAEGRLQGRIASDDVVRLVETIEVGSDPALLLELVEGRTLAQRLEQEPLSAIEIHALALALARGLDAIHAAGVVHGDLKPSNVLLVEEGANLRAKIGDFGVASDLSTPSPATKSAEELVGTPGYLAPEIVCGDAMAGPPSDFYALGVLLFQAAGGVLPSAAEMALAPDLAAIPRDYASIRARVPRASGRLVLAISRCLEPSWEARMTTGRELEAIMSTEEEQSPGGEATEVYRGDGEADLRPKAVDGQARTVELDEQGAPVGPRDGDTLYQSGWMLASMVVVVLVLGGLLWARSGQSPAPSEGEHVPLEQVLTRP
jgi:serine/threonine protein kinase